MKKKQIIGLIVLVGALISVGFLARSFWNEHVSSRLTSDATTTMSVQFVRSTIAADGAVTAQNQAKLNFQTGGKLVRLPFKEGDKVKAGQTIAQLDTYDLQRQLRAALNTYRSTRDVFDQAQQNSQDDLLNHQNASTYTNVGIDSSIALNMAVKRIVDENQASLDNSVINVELANYALQLSSLTSPLNGIVTHEDVNVPGTNITTTTTFVIADPSTMVFRANVPAEEISYVHDQSSVSLAVDGLPNKIQGTVVRIYPAKMKLANGQDVYQVDIASDALKQQAKLDEAGTALISTDAQNVALVPAWTVLGGQYIWVDNTGTPELRQVTVGKTIGNKTEVMSGLTANDHIIVDPKFLPSRKYQLL